MVAHSKPFVTINGHDVTTGHTDKDRKLKPEHIEKAKNVLKCSIENDPAYIMDNNKIFSIKWVRAKRNELFDSDDWYTKYHENGEKIGEERAVATSRRGGVVEEGSAAKKKKEVVQSWTETEKRMEKEMKKGRAAEIKRLILVGAEDQSKAAEVARNALQEENNVLQAENNVLQAENNVLQVRIRDLVSSVKQGVDEFRFKVIEQIDTSSAINSVVVE